MKNLRFKRYKIGEIFDAATAERDTFHLVPSSTDPITIQIFDVDAFGNIAEVKTDDWAANKQIILQAVNSFESNVDGKIDKTSISDEINSTDDEKVASSNALKLLSDFLKSYSDTATALKIDKASISNSTSSQSTTTVASSKSVNDAKNEMLSGISGRATQLNAPTAGLGFKIYSVIEPLTSPNSWGNNVVTADDLKDFDVFFDVVDGTTITKKTKSKSSAAILFDVEDNILPATMKATNDHLVESGLINTSYRFQDDFSTNLGWISSPSFPLTPVITGGMLKLDLTDGTNQAVQIDLPVAVTSDEILTIKLRHRVIGGTGTQFVVGNNNFGSVDAPTHKVITPTSEWQVSEVQVTGAAGTTIYIASPDVLNDDGEIQIDYFYIDQKTTANHEDVLGKANWTDLATSVGNGGSVYLKPTEYTIDDFDLIPNGTALKGVKGRTVVHYTGDISMLVINGTRKDISLVDIDFEGGNPIIPSLMTAAQVKSKAGIGTQNAIEITGDAENIFIEGCNFRNFNGMGLKATFTHDGSSDFGKTMKITNNVFHNNYLGAYWGERSEYNQISGNTFFDNQINGWCLGGNNFGSVNHFNGGSVGFVVEGKPSSNDSHGSMVACTFNHSLSYGLFIFNVNTGFTFTACHVFQGDIYIDNSTGFVFIGGLISAGIQSANERVAGSNIIALCVFFPDYGGGTITGSPARLSLKNNMRSDGSSSAALNNLIS